MICNVRFSKIVRHGVHVLPVILLNVLGALAQNDSGWATPKIQTSPSITVFNLIKTDLDSSVHDGVSFVTDPVHFGWKEWTIATLCIGATGSLVFADTSMKSFAQSHRTANRDQLILPWEYYGSGYTGVAIGAAAYCGGLWFSSPWWRETGREVLTALAISGATGEILKIGFGRMRPYTGQGPKTFNHFTLQDSSSSFPSGHTMTAFVVSSVLAERIDNPFISCGFYAMALFTGAERIYSNNHWLSDVFFGAILGTVIGHGVAHKEEDVIHGGGKLTWEIAPDISLSNIGLTLKTDF